MDDIIIAGQLSEAAIDRSVTPKEPAAALQAEAAAERGEPGAHPEAQPEVCFSF